MLLLSIVHALHSRWVGKYILCFDWCCTKESCNGTSVSCSLWRKLIDYYTVVDHCSSWNAIYIYIHICVSLLASSSRMSVSAAHGSQMATLLLVSQILILLVITHIQSILLHSPHFPSVRTEAFRRIAFYWEMYIYIFWERGSQLGSSEDGGAKITLVLKLVDRAVTWGHFIDSK